MLTDLENEPEHGPPIPLFYLKETEEQFYFSSVVKSLGRTGSLFCKKCLFINCTSLLLGALVITVWSVCVLYSWRMSCKLIDTMASCSYIPFTTWGHHYGPSVFQFGTFVFCPFFLFRLIKGVWSLFSEQPLVLMEKRLLCSHSWVWASLSLSSCFVWKWDWFLLKFQLDLKSFPLLFVITVVFESLNFAVLCICFTYFLFFLIISSSMTSVVLDGYCLA